MKACLRCALQIGFRFRIASAFSVSTPGPVVIAVSAFGEAPIGRIIRRGGAQPGDIVFVTGTIGDAALGLAALRGALGAPDPASVDFLINRYRVPQPRLTLGRQLAAIATAAIDISDGLVADLRHVCEVSRLSAIIEAKAIPLSVAARAAIGGDSQRFETALTGGDDYELLFTAAPSASVRVSELSRSTGIPITPIGRMTLPLHREEPHVLVLGEASQPLSFATEGWTHFGKS